MVMAKPDFKQVIVLRKDLKLSMGKAAAQACHASVEAFHMICKAREELAHAWLRNGAKKVVLSCKDGKQLKELHKRAKELNLPHALIADAGLTEIPRGTFTALAIGPEEEGKVNKVTGSLPLLK